MEQHLVTGGAGFVAVNLARCLLKEGKSVIAVDDLSRGRIENLAEFKNDPNFTFIKADCANISEFCEAVKAVAPSVTDVWHMAANSDISAGVADPQIDLHRTFMTTVGVLAIIKEFGLEQLHFASSSAIYGDLGNVELYEDIGPLEPISNYGAMKLASEAQIRAAVEDFLPRANIFRFPNVIGVPATHGVILDFVRKLKKTPDQLEVLGNGTQQKAYLHVSDLIGGMMHIRGLEGRYCVFNIGPEDDGITVRTIAETVRDRVSPKASIRFGKEGRGWVGDVPRFRYSTQRLASTGWRPSMSSRQAVARAVEEIATQELS